MRALTTSFLFALVVIGGSCSSGGVDDDAGNNGDEPNSSDEIATLEDETTDDETGPDTTTGELVADEASEALPPEESSLKFSQCMRSAGVDFPDLGVDANGNIDLGDLPADFDTQDPAVQDAFTECQSILAAGGFGERLRETIESAEFEQALLDFSDCVREQGYDVGDLTITNLAAAAFQTPAPTDQANPEGGEREEGFGDRDGIFAVALGLDPEDLEVQEAINTCNPIMEGAMAGLGFG